MKIPWSLRLVLYASTTLLLACYYDSWSTTMGMLIRMGVYENACTPEQIAEGSFDLAKCTEQQIQISGLLSIFRIAEFVTSMAIGVFMDLAGTKSCVGVGIGLRTLSWFLLSGFPRTNWVMILGCVLTGVSVNAIVFPVYTIGRYWPAYQDISMCIVSISLSAGCFYSLIVNLVWDLMPTVNTVLFVGVKVAITHIPMLIIAMLIFPNNIVKDIDENMTESMIAKNLEKNIQDQPVDDAPWSPRTFLSYVIKPEVIVITVFFVLNCVSLTFAQESFTQVYVNNKTAEQVNSILLPLSSVFSLMLMWIINRFGTTIVIFSLNIVSVAMHLTLLSSTTVASVFVSIGISMTFSGFITFFFIFLENIVEIKYSGSIKGYLTAAAGITMAVNPGLNALIAAYGVMNACQISFVVLRVVAIPALIWLNKKERARRLLKMEPSLEMSV